MIKKKLEKFVTRYDAPQQLHRLTGLLHAHGLLPPIASLDAGYTRVDPYLRLGACAVKLTEYDACYQLGDGRRLLDLSANLATALLGREPSGEFERRMVSYWHSAAGRVLYRLRDYPGALQRFVAAEKVAGVDDWAWSCASDRIRGELEIKRAFASSNPERVAAACSARDELLQKLRKCLNLTEGASEEAISKRLAKEFAHETPPDERLLGALSLFHNYCDAGGCTDLMLRRAVVNSAYEAGERYRSLQLLHGILSTFEREGYKDIDEKSFEADFNRLMESETPRLRLMARQRKAARLSCLNQAAGSLALYRELLEELATDRKQLGAGYFHHEVHNYVLAGIQARHPEQEGSDWFRQEQLQLVESLRSLISVPMYKSSFAQWCKPILSKIVHSIVSRFPDNPEVGDLEELVGIAEMGSCRELLDVLAGRLHSATPRRKGKQKPQPVSPETVKERGGGAYLDGGGPKDAVLAAPVIDLKSCEEAMVEIDKRAQDAASYWSNLVVPPVPHDPDALYKSIQESLRGQSLFLRFVSSVTGGGTDWRVVWVASGSTGWVPLDREAISSLLKTDWSAIQYSPNLEQCKAIWSALLAPLADKINASERLVIVPSDALWRVPFQAAMMPDEGPTKSTVPLTVRKEVVLTTSLTAYVTHGRARLDAFTCSYERDDFVTVNALSSEESSVLDRVVQWVTEFAPAWGGRHICEVHKEGWSSTELLEKVAEIRPEFLYWVGHGQRFVRGDQVEIALLGPDRKPYLTTYDLLIQKAFDRNKLCVITSCMAAGGDTGQHGELRGFIRALQGTGAGAIILPHWQISAWAGPAYVRGLFEGFKDSETVSIAAKIKKLNGEIWSESGQTDLASGQPMRSLPFSLIL